MANESASDPNTATGLDMAEPGSEFTVVCILVDGKIYTIRMKPLEDFET